MSDTSGLPNTDDLGVPAEDDPERFEGGAGAPKPSAPKPSAPKPGGQNTGAPNTGGQNTGAPNTGAGAADASTAGANRDAQASEPDEHDPGQGGDDVSDAHRTGVAPEGAEDVTTRDTQGPASHGSDGAEPPPADFDPTEQPSNPDLVQNTEPPDE